MSSNIESLYKRIFLIIFILIGITIVLYFAKTLLIPIAFGGLFALLLNPVQAKLVSWNINKYISGILSTLLIVIFLGILVTTLAWQIKELADQSEEIREEVVNKYSQLQDYISSTFGVDFKGKEYTEKAVGKFQDNLLKFVGSMTEVISMFMLSLIYSIVFLAQRTRINKFFLKLFKNKEKAHHVVNDLSDVTRKYLLGKLLMIGILATIYSIGFLIIGIKYAILLAVLSAFLTFIPLVGNLIGGALVILITLATGGNTNDILWILGIITAAQLLESYILEPWIVGESVDLNPIFSILMVIAFGSLWGAAGAIIALPLSAMLKVIFSNVEGFKPLGFLMSDRKEED